MTVTRQRHVGGVVPPRTARSSITLGELEDPTHPLLTGISATPLRPLPKTVRGSNRPTPGSPAAALAPVITAHAGTTSRCADRATLTAKHPVPGRPTRRRCRLAGSRPPPDRPRVPDSDTSVVQPRPVARRYRRTVTQPTGDQPAPTTGPWSRRRSADYPCDVRTPAGPPLVPCPPTWLSRVPFRPARPAVCTRRWTPGSGR